MIERAKAVCAVAVVTRGIVVLRNGVSHMRRSWMNLEERFGTILSERERTGRSTNTMSTALAQEAAVVERKCDTEKAKAIRRVRSAIEQVNGAAGSRRKLY